MGSAVGVMNLGRASARRVRAAFGSDSEVGLSLRKVTMPVKRRVPPFEDREVGRNHEAGARNQYQR